MKFKIGDLVQDCHPKRSYIQTGTIMDITPTGYAVKFPAWKWYVRRIEGHVIGTDEVNDLMKEVL